MQNLNAASTTQGCIREPYYRLLNAALFSVCQDGTIWDRISNAYPWIHGHIYPWLFLEIINKQLMTIALKPYEDFATWVALRVSCNQQTDKETKDLTPTSSTQVWVTCGNSLLTRLHFRLVLSPFGGIELSTFKEPRNVMFLFYIEVCTYN